MLDTLTSLKCPQGGTNKGIVYVKPEKMWRWNVTVPNRNQTDGKQKSENRNQNLNNNTENFWPRCIEESVTAWDDGYYKNKGSKFQVSFLK